MAEKGMVIGFDSFVSRYQKKWGHEPPSSLRQTHLRIRGVVPTFTDLQMYLGLGQSKYGEYASLTFQIPRPAQQSVFRDITRLRERCAQVQIVDTGTRRNRRQLLLWGSETEETGWVFVRAVLTRKNRVSRLHFGSIFMDQPSDSPVEEGLT